MSRRLFAGTVAAVTVFSLAASSQVADLPSGVLHEGLGVVSTQAPLRTAADVLTSHAEALGVDPRAFAFDDVATSPIGTHVRGREVRGGIPVLDSSAAVHIATDGRLLGVEARPVDLPGTPAAAPVPSRVAELAALTHVGSVTPFDVTTSRWMVTVDGRLVDVWRVAVVDLDVPVAAVVEVRALDASVLRVVDERRHISGAAILFDPNPIVALQDNTLRQALELGPVDADVNEFSDARVAMDLQDVAIEGLAAGLLQGPWVRAIGGAAIPPPVNGHWLVDLNRSAPQFETLMAYAHLDRVQRYFQDVLGFVGETGVNAEMQEIVTFPVPGFDNSFYMGGSDFMLLGGGGVDDGEDAEVILHEYGHAVHDAQVPGWGRTHEGGAMGEGFGDFLAAAFFASHSSAGYQDTCLMEWDSTSYSSETPTCIRRMDRAKVYPDAMEGSVHADGELWSRFLWNVRERIVPASQAAGMGKGELAKQRTDRVLKALLTSHWLLTPNAGFKDATLALRQVATEFGDANLVKVIDEEAKAIGFLA